MFQLTDVLKFKIASVVALVLLAAFLGLFAYFKVQTAALEGTIDSQRKELGSLVVQVSTLTAANKAMEASVKEQNARVEMLLADFKVTSAAAEKAITKAQTEVAIWRTKYRAALTAPPVSADACADLSAKVNAYLTIRAEGGL